MMIQCLKGISRLANKAVIYEPPSWGYSIVSRLSYVHTYVHIVHIYIYIYNTAFSKNMQRLIGLRLELVSLGPWNIHLDGR